MAVCGKHYLYVLFSKSLYQEESIAFTVILNTFVFKISFCIQIAIHSEKTLFDRQIIPFETIPFKLKTTLFIIHVESFVFRMKYKF